MQGYHGDIRFKGSLAARNFWRRIPLMQNFFKIFQKKSSRHEKYNIPNLAYGLKEVTIFFKPINILTNELEYYIGQAKAFHSVCPNNR